MFGSRALWANGWSAVAWHRSGSDWAQDQWELYHQDVDYTQSNDLAGTHPDKLKELIALWYVEAKKHNVFPLDDRGRERTVERGRPLACEVRPRYVYYPGTAPVPFNAVPRLLHTRHRITAHLRIPASGAQGIIITEGSNLGGWALFLRDGRAHYVHNCLRMSTHVLTSTLVIPRGEVTLTFEFEPTGNQTRTEPAKSSIEPASGSGRLWINGQDAGFLEQILTAPLMYSFVAEGFQIGENWGTTVAHEYYDGPFKFNGTIHKVVVELPDQQGQ